jgi:hypothetical protein
MDTATTSEEGTMRSIRQKAPVKLLHIVVAASLLFNTAPAVGQAAVPQHDRAHE